MKELNPYTEHKGKQEIKNAPKDQFGNAKGTSYDLAKDGAFKGVSIAVLHLYTGEGFNFSLPLQALQEKGFSIIRWADTPPPISEFNKALEKVSQLWIISDRSPKLSQECLVSIKNFFDKGKGVYIWGDNEPFYADANQVSQFLIGVQMQGNVYGDKTVKVQVLEKNEGFVRHLITTGIEKLYEGVTIATIQDSPHLRPLLYGSAKNIVASLYVREGKRLIIDGGFTRLYCNWDTAGTARYVKNAATWLTNFERFGNKIFHS